MRSRKGKLAELPVITNGRGGAVFERPGLIRISFCFFPQLDLEDLDVVIDFPNQPRDTIGNNYEIPSNLQVRELVGRKCALVTYSLQYLSLINNRIRAVTNLDNCKELVHLCLRQNFVSSDSLSGLNPVAHSLIKLDLYENQIDGVGLSNYTVSKNDKGEMILFPALRYLDLSFNPIRQLNTITKGDEVVETVSLREGGTLAAFPALEYLYFVECKMTRIPFLDCCPDLKVLELGGNRIRNIEGVENLPNLRDLWLGKNKIVSIEVCCVL